MAIFWQDDLVSVNPLPQRVVDTDKGFRQQERNDRAYMVWYLKSNFSRTSI